MSVLAPPPFETIAELRNLLEQGSTSAVELAEQALERLERHGGRYHAVACLMRERALRSARKADRRRARGERTPLLGIPYGLKDIATTRGAPTRAGSLADLGMAADRDATVVTRLERAGAVLTAKLALVELVGFLTRDPANSNEGPAISPWGERQWAGGSSGGSGAAVAAGLVPVAIGSETAGSIGSPSAWNGVTGFRPTLGLVGRGGIVDLSPSLDKIGVLAHAAEDCADVLEAIAAPDPLDGASLRRRFRRARVDDWLKELGRVRVGYAPSDFEEVAPPSTRKAFGEAVSTFGRLGSRLVEATIPQDVPYREALDRIVAVEGAFSFRSLVERGEVDRVRDPLVRATIRDPGVSALQYLQAQHDRSRLARLLGQLFQQVEVLVTYNFVFPWPPPTVDADYGDVPIAGGNTAMVWAGNLAGLPAVFLPAGLSDEGHPVSIQVVGPPGADALVLALGVAFQRETDWHRMRPPGAPAD